MKPADTTPTTLPDADAIGEFVALLLQLDAMRQKPERKAA